RVQTLPTSPNTGIVMYGSGGAGQNNQLHSLALTGSATDVLRGNGTWGPSSGGTLTNICPTTNFIPKTNGATQLICSQIFDNATAIGINNTAPKAKVDIFRAFGTTIAGSTDNIGLNVVNSDRATGFSGGTGIVGTANAYAFINGGVGGSASNAAISVGVSGFALTSSNVYENWGVWGRAGTATLNYGIYGDIASGTHPNNCAGYFNGDVMVTGFFSAASDAKLKTNIQEFKNGLAQLKKLEPKTYDFKQEEYQTMNFPDGNQIGLIAQNVQAVFPNLVREKVSPTSIDPVTHQKIADRTRFLTVNYIGLVPVLIEAVKELDTKTEENAKLKAALDNTNAIVAALQNQINDICNNGCAGLRTGVNTDLTPNLENKLMQNIPNPFSQQTVIGYVINKGTSAFMNINSLDGKIVKHVELETKGAGTISINGDELSAGTYTYSLYVDGKVIDTKIMVITSQK
ncbi:MAG: chaperone of endosialidase, partial [Bacteroidetes bacterium]|nr:chaperone of endosialidase [Bacteroidota bacterium]